METDQKITQLFEKIDELNMHDYDSDPEPELEDPWYYFMEIAELVIYHGYPIDSNDLNKLYHEMMFWNPDEEMTEDIRYLRLNRLT